jgi:hypothetical protein
MPLHFFGYPQDLERKLFKVSATLQFTWLGVSAMG